MRTTSSLGAAMLLGILLAAPTGAAWAKKTTINDITLDLPDAFTVESSNRGILAKTPDGEVDVWVETYLPDDEADVVAEHKKYWKKEKVVLDDNPVVKDTPGDMPVHTTAFMKSTWKGDPTIVRYIALGPVGPKKETVLITYWASPEGEKDFNAAIGKMIDTLDVKIAQ